ncbi:MAG: hypothetical protein HYZ51_02715 [Candidatus Doudnabacteria bacterium]|nr:hypothetical protein [Candidatus Doudnabacteria bacterium]
MNRKTIIQIIVIVICFGGSGFVLYNGLFKKQETVITTGGGAVPGSPPAPVSSVASPADPLPFGDNLSGELSRVLKRNGLQFGQIDYPQVSASEVGVPTEELVRPLPVFKE